MSTILFKIQSNLLCWKVPLWIIWVLTSCVGRYPCESYEFWPLVLEGTSVNHMSFDLLCWKVPLWIIWVLTSCVGRYLCESYEFWFILNKLSWWQTFLTSSDTYMFARICMILPKIIRISTWNYQLLDVVLAAYDIR
jgi:hypothetical protein